MVFKQKCVENIKKIYEKLIKQKCGKHLKKMIISDMILQKEFVHKGRY